MRRRPAPGKKLGSPLLALLCLVGATVLTGCSSRPDDPSFDNPYDPQGPAGGDPFNLVATASNNNVLVRWTQPQHPNVVSYIVLHSLNGQSFTVAGEVDHIANSEVNSFIHNSAAPNAINWYKVQALSNEGLASSSAAVQAVPLTTPPYFQIAAGATNTPTRFVTLEIRTTTGDSLWIADNENFTSATVLPAEPGEPSFLDWDLGPAAANGEDKNLYVKVQTGIGFSELAHRSIQTSFTPRFAIVGDENGVATQVVDLEISTITGRIEAAGVDSMRFARSEAELAATAWSPGGEVFSGYVLVDNPGQQTIYGEFLSDFGYTAASTHLAIPDDLDDVAFTVQSLTNNPDITNTAEVKIVSQLGALEMRFAESPAFVGIPWQTYADTTLYTLSEGEGLKIVYGQFRNFWAQSVVVSDGITRATQELEVAFLAPQPTAVVRGGSQLTVEGLAVPATGYDAVDLVEVDLGDGFVAATGTVRWTTLWNIPLLSEDTPVILRARASIGDTLATTTSISVTISQLVATIVEPPGGSVVAGGSDLTVEGTASALLGGAPLDSVVVGLAGTDTLATGMESWSLIWRVPGVTENLEVLITATAWAGGEPSPPDTIAVTITP